VYRASTLMIFPLYTVAGSMERTSTFGSEVNLSLLQETANSINKKSSWKR